MVLVHYAPFCVDLLQAYRQAEFEWLPFASAIDIDASSLRRRESNFGTCGNLDVVEIESNRLLYVREEELPRGHVGVDAARLKWRRYIEHQNIRVVIVADSGEVFSSNCFGPSIDECANLLNIVMKWIARHMGNLARLKITNRA